MQGKRVLICGVVSICFLFIVAQFTWYRSFIPEVFTVPYRTAVEQEYRLKYEEAGLPIPSKNFWTSEIGGLTPQGVLEQRKKRLYQEFTLLEKETKQLGGATENLRLDGAGWQEISETMASNRQFIKDSWINQLEDADILAYYQKHIDRFSEQAPIKGKLSFWQNGVEIWNKEVDISAETVRMVTEQYPELDLILPQIVAGERESWQRDGGVYQFVCTDRQDGMPLPFEEVIEAVASQLVEEKLNHWLEAKLGGETEGESPRTLKR